MSEGENDDAHIEELVRQVDDEMTNHPDDARTGDLLKSMANSTTKASTDDLVDVMIREINPHICRELHEWLKCGGDREPPHRVLADDEMFEFKRDGIDTPFVRFPLCVEALRTGALTSALEYHCDTRVHPDAFWTSEVPMSKGVEESAVKYVRSAVASAVSAENGESRRSEEVAHVGPKFASLPDTLYISLGRNFYNEETQSMELETCPTICPDQLDFITERRLRSLLNDDVTPRLYELVGCIIGTRLHPDDDFSLWWAYMRWMGNGKDEWYRVNAAERMEVGAYHTHQSSRVDFSEVGIHLTGQCAEGLTYPIMLYYRASDALHQQIALRRNPKFIQEARDTFKPCVEKAKTLLKSIYKVNGDPSSELHNLAQKGFEATTGFGRKELLQILKYSRPIRPFEPVDPRAYKGTLPVWLMRGMGFPIDEDVSTSGPSIMIGREAHAYNRVRSWLTLIVDKYTLLALNVLGEPPTFDDREDCAGLFLEAALLEWNGLSQKAQDKWIFYAEEVNHEKEAQKARSKKLTPHEAMSDVELFREQWRFLVSKASVQNAMRDRNVTIPDPAILWGILPDELKQLCVAQAADRNRWRISKEQGALETRDSESAHAPIEKMLLDSMFNPLNEEALVQMEGYEKRDDFEMLMKRAGVATKLVAEHCARLHQSLSESGAPSRLLQSPPISSFVNGHIQLAMHEEVTYPHRWYSSPNFRVKWTEHSRAQKKDGEEDSATHWAPGWVDTLFENTCLDVYPLVGEGVTLQQCLELYRKSVDFASAEKNLPKDQPGWYAVKRVFTNTPDTIAIRLSHNFCKIQPREGDCAFKYSSWCVGSNNRQTIDLDIPDSLTHEELGVPGPPEGNYILCGVLTLRSNPKAKKARYGSFAHKVQAKERPQTYSEFQSKACSGAYSNTLLTDAEVGQLFVAVMGKVKYTETVRLFTAMAIVRCICTGNTDYYTWGTSGVPVGDVIEEVYETLTKALATLPAHRISVDLWTELQAITLRNVPAPPKRLRTLLKNVLPKLMEAHAKAKVHLTPCAFAHEPFLTEPECLALIAWNFGAIEHVAVALREHDVSHILDVDKELRKKVEKRSIHEERKAFVDNATKDTSELVKAHAWFFDGTGANPGKWYDVGHPDPNFLHYSGCPVVDKPPAVRLGTSDVDYTTHTAVVYYRRAENLTTEECFVADLIGRDYSGCDLKRRIGEMLHCMCMSVFCRSELCVMTTPNQRRAKDAYRNLLICAEHLMSRNTEQHEAIVKLLQNGGLNYQQFESYTNSKKYRQNGFVAFVGNGASSDPKPKQPPSPPKPPPPPTVEELVRRAKEAERAAERERERATRQAAEAAEHKERVILGRWKKLVQDWPVRVKQRVARAEAEAQKKAEAEEATLRANADAKAAAEAKLVMRAERKKARAESRQATREKKAAGSALQQQERNNAAQLVNNGNQEKIDQMKADKKERDRLKAEADARAAELAQRADEADKAERAARAAAKKEAEKAAKGISARALADANDADFAWAIAASERSSALSETSTTPPSVATTVPATPEPKPCAVCDEATSTHLCVPCGHQCLCIHCAALESLTKCPVCHTDLQMRIQVHV